MNEIVYVLIGGICSALGGCLAIWYQAKKARKIRREEVRGEKEIDAWTRAMYLIGRIQTLLMQSTTEDTLKFLYDNDEWFSMNLMFLPHKFEENWRSIKLNLKNLQLFEQGAKGPDGQGRNEAINNAVETKDCNRKLAKEAYEELRKKLNLPEINKDKKTPETE